MEISERFKNQTHDLERVSLVSKHSALRARTEKVHVVKTLQTVCIVIKAAKPPIITSTIISLSGSHGDVHDLVRDGADPPLDEELGDERHDVPVHSVVPASVKPLVKVHNVSGGDIELRHTEALHDRKLGDRLDIFEQLDIKDIPLRFLGHNEVIVADFVATLDMTVTEGGERLTDVRQGRPGPTKTEHRYWFSISRTFLPATAVNHARAVLISNTESSNSGQVERITVMAAKYWRMRDQFSRANLAMIPGQLALYSGTMGGKKSEERNNKTKRPDKGARLSRR